MTSVDPVATRFATTPNGGDLGTGTSVGVAVAQPSPFQASANTDSAEPFEVAKGDKLKQMLVDLGLKTVKSGTDGAVLAMEKLDARNRQLEGQLNAGEQAASSSLNNLINQRKQIANLANYNIDEELEKVTWTPMPINDPPRPTGQIVKAGFFRGEKTIPPTEKELADWQAEVTKHREFVTDVNRKRQEEARKARKTELEKTPEFERRANEMREAVKAIKKAIGDSSINVNELTGVISTVREEQEVAREQQMLMEQDFNSVSAYAMNLRDAIAELKQEISEMAPTDKDLPAKKYLMAELETRKRTIAAIGRDLKNGMQNNAKNIAKTEQRLAMSDTLLDNLGNVVKTVGQLVEDAEGMLRTFGADNRTMITTEQMNQIRDLAQDMFSKFEDEHNQKFADLMNSQPQRDFDFAKKEGERSTTMNNKVSSILERKQADDDDIFGMLTVTGYEGPTKRIGSEAGIDSAIRNGLDSEELFKPAQQNPPPAAQ